MFWKVTIGSNVERCYSYISEFVGGGEVEIDLQLPKCGALFPSAVESASAEER